MEEEFVKAPWIPCSGVHALKFISHESGYIAIITDFISCYEEKLNAEETQQRCQEQNPNLEIEGNQIVEELKTSLHSCLDSKIGLFIIVCNGNGDHIDAKLSSSVSGLPFYWEFSFSSSPPETLARHVTGPLCSMIHLLLGERQLLLQQIKNHERVLEEYQASGFPPPHSMHGISLMSTDELEMKRSQLPRSLESVDAKALFGQLEIRELYKKHQITFSFAMESICNDEKGEREAGVNDTANHEISPVKAKAEPPDKEGQLKRRMELEEQLSAERAAKEKQKRLKKFNL
ncbi:unnamed protein product [Darwinula stevensoni]|uniref:Non-homologous end-joining factor 1 n=1 Tax=Darwinula stevensoni TaxID=69355 RepID=A0A7R9AA86_9CRUS|nr:unnamed protein product [Darwinula stevensoni]CAG0898155.1 unnamed protein product [Darwinula stevensoni]